MKINYLKKVLELTLLDNYFIFDNNLYLQCSGPAMGSPIAPTLGNLFLCYMEKRWMENCPQNFKPVLYRRYVDDTSLLFRKSDHIQLFLNYLNRQHPNIIFTNESKINNALPFLDVTVTKENNKFITSVFRKPTFTGLSSNF